MTNNELNENLATACDRVQPDLDEIRELIIAGADPNQLNRYGNNLFEDIFMDILYRFRGDAEQLPTVVQKIKALISLIIDHGWDVKKYGLSAMDQFKFSTYDKFTFDLYRFMLQYDLTDDTEAYEGVLESIGVEESYQRCCEDDHDLENLFYAIYEMILAKQNGHDYTSIEPYYGAKGLLIDKVLYFGETDTLVEKNDFTEYSADIGFVCGDKLLILRKSVNILFMNDRGLENPQIDISSTFGNDVIGHRIHSISFDHKEIVVETTHYGQPTIILELTNGKLVKFSHNFGEMADGKRQSRFWIA